MTNFEENALLPTCRITYLDWYDSLKLDIKNSLIESKTGPKVGPAALIASANALSESGNLYALSLNV